MNIVLLQSRLSDEEISKLINEFPHYLFLAPNEVIYKNLGNEEWDRVEVIYGSKLSAKELEKAHQLRWIHNPTTNLNALCLTEIENRGNIIVTTTREENAAQIGEYIVGSVLAFAKNLFHWEAADRNPNTLWDSKWRDSMWTLRNRIFIQIGLGSVGTEISKLAKAFGMRVYGVQDRRSFHPHCHKVFSKGELHSILPMADVVCIALPRGQQKEQLLKKEEFELMKQDSILAIIGFKDTIDDKSLAEVANSTRKFRGIIIDAFYQLPISPSSPLWTIPNIIITPEVAPRPKSTDNESYRVFRYNLRQYQHNNFTDMRNVVGTKQLFLT